MLTGGTITADTRYTFTGQYLEAAALFVRKARVIESDYAGSISDELRCEHRAYVSTAVIQSAAALETESHEICAYGPGAYLGSSNLDRAAHEFLQPLGDVVDDQDVISRFELILHVLRKPPLPRGEQLSQNAQLLVRLRNELVHYKSRWGAEMTTTKLFASLKSLRHTPPPFALTGVNFFPHQCLSADCAAWSVMSALEFLEAVYERLGVRSRFESYRERLVP